MNISSCSSDSRLPSGFVRLSRPITATSRKPPTATSLTYTALPARHPPAPHSRSPALFAPLASGSSHMSHHISQAAPGKGQRPCELMRVACGATAGTRTGKPARARTCTHVHTHARERTHTKTQSKVRRRRTPAVLHLSPALILSRVRRPIVSLASCACTRKCAETLTRAHALLHHCKSDSEGSAVTMMGGSPRNRFQGSACVAPSICAGYFTLDARQREKERERKTMKQG